jgi:hypothetical protein
MKKYFFSLLLFVSFFGIADTISAQDEEGGFFGTDMSGLFACLDAADAKYENKDGQICLPACKEFYWYGCMYDPGKGTQLQNCIMEQLPELKAARDECKKKYNLEETALVGDVPDGKDEKNNQEVDQNQLLPETSNNAPSSVDSRDNEACKQSCQSNYNVCNEQCKPIEPEKTQEEKDAEVTCQGRCEKDYKNAYNSILPACSKENVKCVYVVTNKRNDKGNYVCNDFRDGTPCGKEIEQCKLAFEACVKPAEDAKKQCFDGCAAKEMAKPLPDGKCENTCQQNKNDCTQNCQISNNKTTQSLRDKELENEQPIGVSSLDFRELARAQAEYQKAQADLEKIKQSGDSRWENKKNFSDEYASEIEKISGKLSREKDGKVKDLAEIVRADLEKIHDSAEIIQNANDLTEYIDEGKFGGYDGKSLFTDAAKGLTDYMDLRNKGVSVKDASSKSFLDNFGSSALTTIPVLKAIDIVASAPDAVFGIVGVPENHWSRTITGFIGKFAPSGVVKQTTDLMIEDDWDDIGNALAYGYGKVKSADGVVNTVVESGKLLAGTIGAVPVAIARGFSETLGATIFVGEKTASFVYNLFVD